MSSSNRVRLTYIEETDYGTTPAGDMTEVKMTSESMSGTPQTVESQEIRSDRQNSGQVNTGLEMSGGFEYELSADDSIKFFIEQAMMDDGTAATAPVSDLTIDASDQDAITVTTINTFSGISAGDIVVLSGFANAANNQPVLVTNATGTVLTVVGEGLVSGTGGSAALNRPLYYEVGTTRKSCTVSKEYLDVVGEDSEVDSVVYRGCRTSEMSMNFAFGEIVTGTFGVVGNGYETPDTPITDGRTVNPAGSDAPLDASNGMGWVLIDNEAMDVCIESLAINLNNNVEAQNCIGNLAPTDQIPFSAAIGIDMTMHLGPTSFEAFMPKKLSQEPISVSFYTRDFNDNGYAVTIPRVQLSFDDPTSGGRDQHVMMEAAGTASYDSAFGNSLRIYIIE